MGSRVHGPPAELTCEKRGRMVLPAWPPTTGTSTWLGCEPTAWARKVLARTMSRVVTPNTRLALSRPRALKTSLAMGTVELTGFCGRGRKGRVGGSRREEEHGVCLLGEWRGHRGRGVSPR